MKAPARIIINSDDFGISNSVNTAIVQCFEAGHISSTTLMAGMPGFDDAVSHYHTNPAVKNRVGLHMNLTEGTPLTDPIKKCPRFCNSEGQLVYNRSKPIFTLTGDEQKAVHTEIKAQVSKLVKAGVTPTHLDAHHHVHTEFGIAMQYLQIGKEFGIKKVRLSKNIGNISKAKKIYKNLYNFYLQKIKDFATTDYFCSADEFRALMAAGQVQAGKSYEVMVHAMQGPRGELNDIDHTSMAAKIDPITAIYKPISYFEFG